MPDVPRVAVTLTQCWHRVPGGTATSVLEMVDALDASGRVEVVGVGPRSAAPPSPRAPSVEVVRLPVRLPFLYDAWTFTGRPTIEGVTGPVDVVHLTVPITPPSTPAPLVATVHDLFPLTTPEHFTGRGARLMSRGLDRIRDRAAAVVVPSRAVADDCAAHGFDPARVHVVPWGAPAVAPSDVDDAAVTRVRERYGLRGPYVLFVGTVEPRKGLATLAAAMSRLDRADLTLALAGPQGWGTDLDELMAGVASPVERLGFVPPGDLPALQRAAAAFCYPSIAEGFGLPVLEAMAAGAAVVTTADTSMAEVAGDAALLVPGGDPDALAAALAEIVDDGASADTLRRRGIERASGFTWKNVADQMLTIYDAVRR